MDRRNSECGEHQQRRDLEAEPLGPAALKAKAAASGVASKSGTPASTASGSAAACGSPLVTPWVLHHQPRGSFRKFAVRSPPDSSLRCTHRNGSERLMNATAHQVSAWPSRQVIGNGHLDVDQRLHGAVA